MVTYIMKKINNLREMFDYLDTINDPNNNEYDYCKEESYGLYTTYEKFLDKVLEIDKNTKRVVDVGSCFNQYAYIFENAGIEYIGIDYWNSDRSIKPYESKYVKFIGAKYEDIADNFKNDIIISNLCVGYLVDIKDVKAKHLIINELNDTKDDFDAKLVW